MTSTPIIDVTNEIDDRQHYIVGPDGKPKYVDGTYDKDHLLESAVSVASKVSWPSKRDENKFLQEVAAKFGISPSVVNLLITNDSHVADVIANLESYVQDPTQQDVSVDISSRVVEPKVESLPADDRRGEFVVSDIADTNELEKKGVRPEGSPRNLSPTYSVGTSGFDSYDELVESEFGDEEEDGQTSEEW